jgi:hypothetical protein
VHQSERGRPVRTRPWRPLIALAAVVGCLTPASPAWADQAKTATVPLVASAWFWSQQVSGVGAPGSEPVALQDPTVPKGDLAVAGPEQGGKPQKETYLSFDMSSVPAGATILAFSITLPVDPAGTNLTPSGGADPIVACTPLGSWSPGPAQPFSQKPDDHCPAGAPKLEAASSGKSFRVDIATIAQAWVGPGATNTGVAITDDPANTTTVYQAVFGPATALAGLSAQVTYQPATAPAPQASGTSGTGSAPPSSSVSTPAVGANLATGPGPARAATPVLAPAGTSPAGAGATGASATTSGSVAAGTPAASPVGAQAAGTKLAARTRAGGIPAGFWVSGILLLLLVAGVGIVLAAPPETLASGPGRSRNLAKLLSAGAGGRPWAAEPIDPANHN